MGTLPYPERLARRGAAPRFVPKKIEDSHMQIILQEDVDKLGNRGEVVTVAEGYARNYLLPRKLAIEASSSNMKRLEKMRAAFAKKESVEKGDAEKLAELLAPVELEVSRKSGENDQLFGSVTSADVSEQLAAKGFTIDKKKIVLAEPIKTIGEYQIPIKLHRELTTNVKLTVKKEE
jgi:large subunit ribosomal protein L9